MAEDIPHSTNWRPCPGEGGQPLTTPLAYSYNYRDHPGKDNSVLVVTVRTHKGTFKHLIIKIYPVLRVNRE
jgi:hypothetical protein